MLLSWWVGFGSLGGILLLVVAGVALVTGAVGYCPTYQLLKISTYPDLPQDLNAEGQDRSAPLACRVIVQSP